MELLKGIRTKIGAEILSKKASRVKRKVFYANFNLIKTIGVVWDASNTADFACLTKFYQKMHEKNIDVKILGYYPGKELPDQYTAIRYLTCYRRKDLNFFYHPTSSETDFFIRNQYDILIDLNFMKIFPLHYVTALSNAYFKVGLFESETVDSPYDLMMEIKNPIDIESYLVHVVHYLEMINSGTNKPSNN
jgi:hypothetical protein